MSTPSFTQKGFLKFFPVPQFLSMPAVGLDISDHAIRFIEVVRAGECLGVGRHAEALLPLGAVKEGTIVDRRVFVQTLSKLKDDHQLHFVRVSLPEEKAYLFGTRLPHMPESDIRNALEFKLEENIPFKPEDVIFDYTIVGSDPAKSYIDVTVSALPKEVVESYVSAISEAGLTVLACEIEAKAIARSVIPHADPRTFLLIDFGRYKTVLSVVSSGVVQFTSTSNVGGALLTAALQKYFKCSFEEAEKIKFGHELVEHRTHGELFDSLVNALAVLKDEINKVTIYWQTRVREKGVGSNTIDALIISGRDALIPGLDQYFAQSFKLTTTLANVWTNVCSFDVYIPQISLEDSLSYAPAIGLALPDQSR